MDYVSEELTEIIRRVRAAKETLGLGGSNPSFDCVYLANKELEIVVNRLQELANTTKE